MILLLIILALVLLYLIARLSFGINRSNVCLIGKTAIITGANAGLGYQTALNLAARGCKIIMADVADMEESRKNIIKYTNNTNIYTKKLDLSSFKSVRSFASDILKSEERLDILINNAGLAVNCCVKSKTEDGLHSQMQINYFGHFLLTHLLVDLLKKSAPSRIVFTSSFMAFTNNLTVGNLNFDSQSNSMINRFQSYGNSKLAMLIASDIFAQKLEGTGVTSNAVHPGLVSTAIHQQYYDIYSAKLIFPLMFLLNLYAKDPWEGSQTLVHVAVSKKLEKVTGKYFSDCRPFFKPPAAYNRGFCKEIWEASERLVGLGPSETI